MAIRNLVIGCDGTWNDNDTGAPTNVAKILDACVNRNLEKYYMEGVGTAHWEALPGGIYGANIDRQILGAYNFLGRMFRQKDPARDNNRIFIFGFSRGSYAARRLAGLISFAGIPVKDRDRELGWHLYLNKDADSTAQLKADGRFFDYPIEVLGVWDTVKTTTDPDFDDRKLPKAVIAGYHAMAIDEKRTFFPVLKWNADNRARQIWFAGVHCDIGGGYNESDLSDITLRWMIDSVYDHKLLFKASAIKKLKKDVNGTLHDSCQGIWLPFGAKARTVGKNDLVHESVQKRLSNGYAPGNLCENPTFVER
jgi:uncharacterized protein (DUF2235 family)